MHNNPSRSLCFGYTCTHNFPSILLVCCKLETYKYVHFSLPAKTNHAGVFVTVITRCSVSLVILTLPFERAPTVIHSMFHYSGEHTFQEQRVKA